MEQRKNTGNQRNANAFLRNLDNIWFRGRSALVGIFPLNSSGLLWVFWVAGCWRAALRQAHYLWLLLPRARGLAFGDGIAIATATRQDVTDSQV